MRNGLTDLIGLKYKDNVYYYIKNLQNDIIGILDSNYDIIVNYRYDSWGNILSITDNAGNNITDSNHIGIVNPFRYRSYYYDIETNLYYLNSRYYSPVLGRFLNADGIIGANQDIMSYNLYSYCSNNPIVKVDYLGTMLSLNVVPKITKNINDNKYKIMVQNSMKKASRKIKAQVANRIFIEITRPILRVASGCYGALFGSKDAVDTFQNSLNDSPKNLKYTDDSNLANEIKNSPELEELLNNNLSGKKGNFILGPLDIEFNSSNNLKLSLHGANVYVSGYVENNSGLLDIKVVDTYDFKHQTDASGYEDNFIQFVNNVANTFEGGVIRNYEIVVDFQYCYNC